MNIHLHVEIILASVSNHKEYKYIIQHTFFTHEERKTVHNTHYPLPKLTRKEGFSMTRDEERPNPAPDVKEPTTTTTTIVPCRCKFNRAHFPKKKNALFQILIFFFMRFPRLSTESWSSEDRTCDH